MDTDRPEPPRNPSDDSDARHRHLGDCLIRGFESLELKCTSTIHDDQINTESKEVLYDRLQSYLVPLLHDQLTTLSLLLDDLWKEPESILKRIAELQPEIDHNVAQIKSAIQVVCPDALSSSDKANDQQLKQFKIYRLLELKKMLCDVIRLRIRSVFDAASEHIQLMELSTTNPFEDGREAYRYRVVIEDALDSVKLTINHLKGSEWDVAEDCRRNVVLAIDSELDFIISTVNPLIKLLKFASLQNGNSVRDPLTHHAQLVVPISKLSKIFFKKSSRTGMNKKLASPFTDMNSIQLSSLCQSAKEVPRALKGVSSLLSSAFGLPRDAATYENIIRFAETMASLMETQVHLTVTYLVPLVPQTGVLLDQNYYKDWYRLWSAQFTLAINNLIQDIKTI
ncbi:hypothetical protein MJO28_005169 [Puccinia striiformis f. sp. tritici]|uniref:Uncharacterized protein n=2 Tax=Puccinia striiformis f. sp. tritici TaxID=168172 RepID=A0A0L0VB89_9BASI|nr:hypothetical protein Pst134EA_009337 [Puccinia striiformis f. sp. tritici]KNE96523.1 hypothetical protein PSTG_10231 [Puccinia striiformis f. sp. tritici PST-78]KAH9458107.1 hypothetical protein Pst134EB_010411 [Puccinia striiformis f. sp. tritici]KAH9468806.1 hypothetical protein Pst134EA_009337 [Puccinia striiformis f. sp. tritici]KAI7954769.1 hypothetical protein MJO28_005169 [Puccinia striiformis f. sp. tritici]KAI7960157.1 hypothetical protein MJO29_005225 [Puccinia striiformis f. sp. 